MLALQVEELSAVEGGIILMIILLIATAVVFSVKFALDIALNKKLSARDEQLPRQDTPTLYAIRGNTPPKRRRAGGSVRRQAVHPRKPSKGAAGAGANLRRPLFAAGSALCCELAHSLSRW